jgi:hypothetical protein
MGGTLETASFGPGASNAIIAADADGKIVLGNPAPGRIFEFHMLHRLPFNSGHSILVS